MRKHFVMALVFAGLLFACGPEREAGSNLPARWKFFTDSIPSGALIAQYMEGDFMSLIVSADSSGHSALKIVCDERRRITTDTLLKTGTGRYSSKNFAHTYELKDCQVICTSGKAHASTNKQEPAPGSDSLKRTFFNIR